MISGLWVLLIPFAEELNDKVKPDIIRNVLASQEVATASLRSQLTDELSRMAGKIVESMDVRQEAQESHFRHSKYHT